jgi:protocatechuate 3,4-dioxygenase beta subunit
MELTRREAIAVAAAAVAFGPFAVGAMDDQFTPGPEQLTDEELVLLRDAVEAARHASASDLVQNPKFAVLHPQPVFRELVKAVAKDAELGVCGGDEPGVRIVAAGTIKDVDGKAVSGAMLYAYHTSQKGWYSDKAAHIRAWAGDSRHARLFGYLRSGRDGSFRIRTIRPGGYPRSDLPQHIHIEVEAAGFVPMVTELLFDDDPRLTAAQRDRAKREGFLIASVLPGPEPVFRYEVVLKKA